MCFLSDDEPVESHREREEPEMQLRQPDLVSLEAIVHPALDAPPQRLVHEERRHDHEQRQRDPGDEHSLRQTQRRGSPLHGGAQFFHTSHSASLMPRGARPSASLTLAYDLHRRPA